MKAITLWQPWASLLASGPKKHETRSWKTKHRGWIAIHAAKRSDVLILHAFQMFAREISEIGYSPLPLGAVVGVGRLETIIRCGGPTRSSLMISDFDEVLPYGDYSEGRYAWIFSEMIPVIPAISATGGQRLWNWKPPGRIQLLIGQLDET